MNNLCRVAVAVVLLVILTSLGCSKDKPSGSNQPSAAGTNVAAKALPTSSVKPGSYEDWCEEHQVPESQCTQCHPELIPAFKATGDWCEEHQMPESQCTKCDPKRKPVRPPRST